MPPLCPEGGWTAQHRPGQGPRRPGRTSKGRRKRTHGARARGQTPRSERAGLWVGSEGRSVDGLITLQQRLWLLFFHPTQPNQIHQPHLTPNTRRDLCAFHHTHKGHAARRRRGVLGAAGGCPPHAPIPPLLTFRRQWFDFPLRRRCGCVACPVPMQARPPPLVPKGLKKQGLPLVTRA